MNWENIQRPTETFSDGRTVSFRSAWEANYAFYLDWLKGLGEIKEWEYEPMPRYDFIMYENGKPKVMSLGYLPDFKVTRNNDTFYLVELKGYKQGMMKLKRMKKYYPEIKIELVDSKEYAILKKKVGKMLNFY